MPHDAFISFSSKDGAAAEKIMRGLETRGIKCWISSPDVPTGADFQDSIVTALEASTVMVLVFSTNANNSDEVKKELVLAGEYKLSVLPVRIENVLPSGAFRSQLTIRQYLDLFEDWDNNLAKLADQISRNIQTPAPDRAPFAAPDPSALDLAFWESVKDSDDPAELDAYLQQFPDGRFAVLAKRRAEALKEAKAAPPPIRPVPLVPPVPPPLQTKRSSKALTYIAATVVGIGVISFFVAQSNDRPSPAPQIAPGPAASQGSTVVASNPPASDVNQAPAAASPPSDQPASADCTSRADCIATMLKVADLVHPEAAQTAAAKIASMPPLASTSTIDRAAARQMNADGLTAFHNKDFDTAASAFSNAMSNDPHDTEIVANLGHALLQLRKLPDAASTLEAALALDPRRTSTWVPYGEVLALQNRGDDALQALKLGYIFSGNKQQTIATYTNRSNDPSDPVLKQLFANAVQSLSPTTAGNSTGPSN